MFDNWLTIEEGCAAIGITRTALYNWMSEGVLPFSRKGSLRLVEKSVLAKINLERLEDNRGVRGPRSRKKKK